MAVPVPADVGADTSGSGGTSAGPAASTGGTGGTGTGGGGSDAAAPSITPGAAVGPGLLTSSALCTDPSTPHVGQSPLRRISRTEYNNMVRDLLGDTTQPASQFVAESPMARGVNFEVNTYTLVTSTLIPEQYLEAAEALADTAVSGNSGSNLNNNLLSHVPGGKCGQQNDACAQAFIDYFANKAFRGQYDSTESAALLQIYSDAKAQFDFATGIQAVITTVLTSPRFLFVLEFGESTPTGNVVPLTQYEIAARLALFLWRSVPDDALMTAAANNQLSTPDQIQMQAERMLTATGSDQKTLLAQGATRDFAEQWMELQSTDGVTKDTQYTWPAQLASELKEETLQTVTNQILTENSGQGTTLTDLLTSGQSYINDDVAKLYGVQAPGVGSGTNNPYKKTSVNPSSLSSPVRAGILTNGSVLATQSHTSLSSPTLRGKLVREQVLCDPVPPPPAGGIGGKPIPPPPATIPAGSTTRDQYVQHSTDPNCSGCHEMMDPI
ncbi:MAG: DUF1592 domain-containing protein, partial [Polyangiaceae bacterium]|nr:DUF1592 domain-containing protein [Polyangiaceae bacterium]